MQQQTAEDHKAELKPLIDLLRSAVSGSLATVMRHAGDNPERQGAPYVSLVTIATDQAGAPIFLLSQLADHTRNLSSDDRVSLLIESASRRANPQTGPRLTLMGRISASVSPEAHAKRFLARHPGAARYAGFGDFGYYHMAVERAHWVGGFARARWFPAASFLVEPGPAAAFEKAEPGVLDHMNKDHAQAVDHYAQGLLGRKGQGWQLSGLDPDGLDLIRKGTRARLCFENRLDNPEQIRTKLVSLAKQA